MIIEVLKEEIKNPLKKLKKREPKKGGGDYSKHEI